MDLDAWIKHNITSDDGGWAWHHQKMLLKNIIDSMQAKNIVEVGGGRTPTFERADIGDVKYIVADISQQELDLAPDWVEKVEMDIARPTQKIADGSVDIIFSKMLMEHVSDVKTAYQNMYRMLKPGGVCFHFHPVLYSLPLLLNKYTPDHLSIHLLRIFQPCRHDDGVPKFPAYYDYGSVTQKSIDMLYDCGFKQVHMIPFYGHTYYDRFMPLRKTERAIRALVKKMDISLLATNCYTLLQK